MDPLTMMIASIGMQFFNNYANNEKSKEIQAQQREFQDAAAKHDFERMRKAQAAAAKLALELEAEFHAERMQDIEENYNTLLASFAHSFTISDWPINVLPFIMKGESFGTLFGGTAKSINMHCILTPSNCAWFNEYFYDDLDLRVEAEMNNNWNAQSTHPIVYYGGGWNRREKKLNGRSIPSLIDLNDIDLLKTKLEKIPTMVITPYFDPYLHFKVQLWGMGKDLDTPFRIDIPHGDIEPSDRIFSYDYYKDSPQELSDDYFNTTMDEFVPYLEKLIGLVADKYFWDVYRIAPIFPQIAKNQKLLFFNEDDQKGHYSNLIDCIDKNAIIANGANILLNIVNASNDTNNEECNLALICKALCKVCNSRLEENPCNNDNLNNYLTVDYFGFEDLSFIKSIILILETFKNNESEGLHKKLSSLSENIISHNENTQKKENMEWQVSDYDQYKITDFHKWVDQHSFTAMQLGATEAIAYIRPSKIIVVVFVDDNAKVVYSNTLGGLCVRTTAFYVDQSILDENLIEWSLKEQRYITNKTKFMQKREFDSFERLGKQLDALVNNVRRATDLRNQCPTASSTAQVQPAPQKDVINQIANYFMETNSMSMESESVETVEFDKVRAWVERKLPVRNATKAHIVYTKRGLDYLVCVFFSDDENNGLFGEEYPKKRILCGQCDSEMEAFMNGGEIGTIKL